METLRAQRMAADDIHDAVIAGKMEEAGIKVLNLIPRVTSAGRIVVIEYQQQEEEKDFLVASSSTLAAIQQLRNQKLESQLAEMVGSWSELDIEIGQGIRGQIGVPAAAQLQVLRSIKEASILLDDFLFVAERRMGM